MAARRWRDWPGRFKDEANSSDGLVGLAGTGVAGLGTVLAAPVTAAAGVVVGVGALLWCAWKSLPPKAAHPANFVGHHLSDLALVDEMVPRPVRFGFAGISRVGKTTLLSHLEQQPPPNLRTDNPYALIVSSQSAPPRYFAIIDAAGQQYSQQFLVAEQSDVLIVFIDHSDSNISSAIDPARLGRHEEFLGHLAGHLRSRSERLRSIHFLLNKRDLWDSGPDASALDAWFMAQVNEWRRLSQFNVSESSHSNLNPHDVTALVQRFAAWSR